MTHSRKILNRQRKKKKSERSLSTKDDYEKSIRFGGETGGRVGRGMGIVQLGNLWGEPTRKPSLTGGGALQRSKEGDLKHEFLQLT